MMYLFYPIAYPIAKLLDYVLGQDEGHTYKKAELKSFLQFHREGEEPLRDDEVSTRCPSIVNALLERVKGGTRGLCDIQKWFAESLGYERRPRHCILSPILYRSPLVHCSKLTGR